jgi:hypothetical protein
MRCTVSGSLSPFSVAARSCGLIANSADSRAGGSMLSTGACHRAAGTWFSRLAIHCAACRLSGSARSPARGSRGPPGPGSSARAIPSQPSAPARPAWRPRGAPRAHRWGQRPCAAVARLVRQSRAAVNDGAGLGGAAAVARPRPISRRLPLGRGVAQTQEHDDSVTRSSSPRRRVVARPAACTWRAVSRCSLPTVRIPFLAIPPSPSNSATVSARSWRESGAP